MPPPTVTCPICNSIVSKRSTLLIEPFGRICRNHPEVEKHREKLAEIAAKAAQDKKLEKAMQGLQVMMVVEQLRMLAYGNSLDLTLLAFLWRVPKSIRAEVEKQVREKGPVTEKELQDAVAMMMVMKERGMLP